MTEHEALLKIKELVGNYPSYLSDTAPYSKGYKDGVYQAYGNVRNIINEVDIPSYTQVYEVCCEKNDHGWTRGDYIYAKAEDAIKSMRKHIAYQIREARRNGKNVWMVKHFSDTVMEDALHQESEDIFLRIDKDFWDYRVWADDVSEEPIDASSAYDY